MERIAYFLGYVPSIMIIDGACPRIYLLLPLHDSRTKVSLVLFSSMHPLFCDNFTACFYILSTILSSPKLTLNCLLLLSLLCSYSIRPGLMILVFKFKKFYSPWPDNIFSWTRHICYPHPLQDYPRTRGSWVLFPRCACLGGQHTACAPSVSGPARAAYVVNAVHLHYNGSKHRKKRISISSQNTFFTGLEKSSILGV